MLRWVVGITADHTSLNWGISTATLCPLLLIFLLAGMGKQTVISHRQDACRTVIYLIKGFP